MVSMRVPARSFEEVDSTNYEDQPASVLNIFEVSLNSTGRQ
jgi:hypothetical protein